MRVLVVNPGSSSLKLAVVEDAVRVVDERDEDAASPGDVADRVADYAHGVRHEEAAAVRIVHGGPDFAHGVVVDDDVLARLDGLTDLAPLHNPVGLAAVRSLRRERPDLPVVACFDTGFHATLPDAAAIYAVPREWTERFGIRRYGFHGLNHAYVARRAAELAGRPEVELRTVTCHLGSGASLAAVAGGRSVDTTMGFTPLEGLVMSTRSGTVDPGAVTRLVSRFGLDAEQVERALEEESGLLGLSGRTGDMKEILEAAAAGDDRARLARDVYVHRLRGAVAAMSASLGGVDVLVFTGGVGERSAEIRDRACRSLTQLGVQLDPGRNADPGDGDVELTNREGAVRVFRIAAREDLEMARQVEALLG